MVTSRARRPLRSVLELSQHIERVAVRSGAIIKVLCGKGRMLMVCDRHCIE